MHAARGTGWLRHFRDWLQAWWPPLNGSHAAYNAGKGGAHIQHFARCLQAYLPLGPPVDLVTYLLTYIETPPRPSRPPQPVDLVRAALAPILI